jgi:indole-3-glycerol phosphate synthase
MAVTLDQIVARTRERVAEAKRTTDRADLERRAALHTPRGFRQALERDAAKGAAIIAEIKRASPSRGLIRGSFQVATLAWQLTHGGATALSVLTEEEFFQGSLADLSEASAASPLPCLRKDFIVDEFQLVQARAFAADAVLLIVAALSDLDLRALVPKSRELGLDALCEVHNEGEVERALAAGCDLIGVNNRDLRTFQVDLETALRLAPHLPANVFRVAESGIQSAADILRLRDARYGAFLIGESLMREDAPGDALARLLAGVRANAVAG